MSDTSDQDQATNDPLSQARSILEELSRIREQIDTHLKATEVARKKADDDASYAYQAKVNTEEHAKATAIFKGTAEADASAIATNKKHFDEIVASATVAKAAMDADLKTIADNKKNSEQSTATVTEAAQAINSARTRIEQNKSSTESQLQETEAAKAATQQAKSKSESTLSEIDAFRRRAEEAAKSVNDNLAVSTKAGSEIDQKLAAAQRSEEGLRSIVERLQESHHVATGHEKRVEDLSAKLEELTNRAESLLPGATSAGLAHSFSAQKTRFQEPQRRWLMVFVACIALLILVAAPSFYKAIIGKGSATTWTEVWLETALRLPIAIPLVWLAIYAGRNYMLSLRLEEDYAYKEAISRAFEGYKREMKDIVSVDGTSPNPLTKLCLNVLGALAERPGRIYEGKQRDFSLLGEAMDLAGQADEFRRRKTATH